MRQRLNNKLVVAFSHYLLNQWKLRRVKTQVDSIYNNIPSYSISKQYREQGNSKNPDFIYGELSIESFLYLLDYIPRKYKRKILDLGCGDGKLMLALSLYYSNVDLKGIEIIAGLADAAKYAVDNIESTLKSRNNSVFIENCDFLATNFFDADVIYCNGAAFKQNTWKQLCEKFTLLKNGRYVISVEKKIPDDNFTMLHCQRCSASWGTAIVYIFQKTDR